LKGPASAADCFSPGARLELPWSRGSVVWCRLRCVGLTKMRRYGEIFRFPQSPSRQRDLRIAENPFGSVYRLFPSGLLPSVQSFRATDPPVYGASAD
jgi:hypothetical protein